MIYLMDFMVWYCVIVRYKKFCLMMKLIWWNVLCYNFCWSLIENIGKIMKGEFWRKLQDGLMCDYLRKNVVFCYNNGINDKGGYKKYEVFFGVLLYFCYWRFQYNRILLCMISKVGLFFEIELDFLIVFF